jgi:hypothetical protein
LHFDARTKVRRNQVYEDVPYAISGEGH